MIKSGNMVRNQIIGKILEEYFPDREQRSKLKVLDLAAGTGLIGDGLYEAGFTDIDGVGRFRGLPLAFKMLLHC